MSGTLVLVRHGEIVRPLYTSNFDRAALSTYGETQIRALARSWPATRPSAVYTSPLRRGVESAQVLANAFGRSIAKRLCLREWSADDSGIPQDEYKALERKAWADFEFVPPGRESLSQAATRARQCLEGIAEATEGSTAVKGDRPTEAYKDSIGFAAAAIVESGSGLRLIQDFRNYPDKGDQALPR